MGKKCPVICSPADFAHQQRHETKPFQFGLGQRAFFSHTDSQRDFARDFALADEATPVIHMGCKRASPRTKKNELTGLRRSRDRSINHEEHFSLHNVICSRFACGIHRGCNNDGRRRRGRQRGDFGWSAVADEHGGAGFPQELINGMASTIRCISSSLNDSAILSGTFGGLYRPSGCGWVEPSK